MVMKKLVLTSLLLCAFTVCFAEKVLLPKGTVVTIKILQDTNSKKARVPEACVAGHVYDVDGEHILIQKDTPVDIQMVTKRGSIWDDPGYIRFTPISTTAFNGRLIAFENEYVHFSGIESWISLKMQAKIKAGTTFRAVIANDYYFTIED